MKETKRQLTMYTFMDFPAMERHLEKMAAKGWLIDKAESAVWRYRRIEPKKVHFTVTFFPKASAYDPGPSEEQRTMWDFAEQSGWKLAAQAAQWQFFYNEAEEPIPMETDAAVRVENIHRAAKRGVIRQQILLMALALLQLILQGVQLVDDPLDFLTGSSGMMAVVCWLLVIFLGAWEIGNYIRWHRKAAALAESEGVFLTPALSTRWVSIGALAVLLAVLGLWLASLLKEAMLRAAVFGLAYVAVIFVIVRSLMKLMKKLGVSAKTNLIVTLTGSFVAAMVLIGVLAWGVMENPGQLIYDNGAAGTYLYQGEEREYYEDDLPLRVEDLMTVDYEEYSCRWRGDVGWLLEQWNGRQWPRLGAPGYSTLPKLDYTVTEVKFPLLYSACKGWLLAEQDERDDDHVPEGFKNVYEPVDAAPWRAKEAYRLCRQDTGPIDWYLLCYPGRVVEITFYDLALTAEGMALVGEKLGSQ